MGDRPTWFVASILSLIAVLMIAHLGVLWVGVLECDELARIMFERAEKDPTYQVLATNTECNNVEADFSDAVAKYLAVFLSLLGGAAVYSATRTADDKGGA
jgi:hypothetical protein